MNNKTTRAYSQDQITAYLLLCLALVMDDVENVVKTHPNRKPLATLTKEEFAVENADMTLAAIAGQLEEMGFDYKSMINIIRDDKHLSIEPFIEMTKIRNK